VQFIQQFFCLYFGFSGKLLRIKECVSIRVSNINDSNNWQACQELSGGCRLCHADSGVSGADSPPCWSVGGGHVPSAADILPPGRYTGSTDDLQRQIREIE